MSNAAVFETLLNNAQIAHCREVLVLAGHIDWAIRELQSGFAELSAALWLGDNPPPGLSSAPIDAGRLYLGRELSHVIVNSHSGLHPNSLAAICGAISAGNLFILLCPALDIWPLTVDQDYQRMSSYGFSQKREQLFIARIARLIQTQPQLYLWRQNESLPTLINKTPRRLSLAEAPFKTADQRQMYERIVQVSLGHRRRPLVITAKRGRGKSSALGLAANTLMAEHQKQIVITAPRREAVDSVFARIDTGLRHRLRFLLPRELEQVQPKADLLLVDEAAGIPVPLLSNWLTRYSRVVFSTTNYGYEGYGQGFSLRFQPELERYAPQHKHFSPEQAIRWLCPDPLELVNSDWFLLDASLGHVGAAAVDSYSLIDQQQLMQDEQLLRQVYGLLLGAHYQTTPDDLRMLLDGPQIKLALALAQGQPVGVALIGVEGNLPLGLHVDICAGKRRLSGHLVPQLIAATTACDDWLAKPSWRIIRIAVHPARRRSGVASGLLQCIAAEAQLAGIQWLSASFGLAADVLSFWLSNNFKPVCISTRVDAASGTHSGVVALGLNSVATQSVERLQRQLLKGLPLALRDYLNGLDVATVIGLVNSMDQQVHVSDAALQWFAFGHTSLSANLVALDRKSVV